MTKKALPQYVYRDRKYIRFIRRARGQNVMMKEEPGTPEFWDHYNRLVGGEKPKRKPGKRTFKNLAKSYFASDKFAELAPRTQRDYRTYIEKVLAIWGDMDPAKLEPKHVYELHRANADRWRLANWLVQVLVVLLNHARLIGFVSQERGNAAKGIPLFKQESEGWEPWPDDVREEFERVATPRARLVYELCIGTGQRIGDVILMRWDLVRDGGVTVKQGKTGKELWVPLTERLRAYLATVERKGLTIVTRQDGRPASYRIIAEEMRDVKTAMQHPRAAEFVTHGLRKNATMELYLAGCDDEEVKAITGHSGVEMLKKYGGKVRQRAFAERAQAARDRREQNKPKT